MMTMIVVIMVIMTMATTMMITLNCEPSRKALMTTFYGRLSNDPWILLGAYKFGHSNSQLTLESDNFSHLFRINYINLTMTLRYFNKLGFIVALIRLTHCANAEETASQAGLTVVLS